MSRKLIGILSSLVCSFLFAGPASAVTLPACGPNADGTNHFTLVAKDLIDLEGGNVPGQTIINKIPSSGDAGNLLVTSLTGKVEVGPNVTINGTVTAKTINFPGNGTSVIANCVADIITGNPGASGPSCFPVANHPADFTAFLAAHSDCVDTAGSGPTFETLCGPTPVVDACVNSAPNLTVAMGATVNLPDASGRTCFKNVNLNDGAVLNLTGTFTFGTLLVQSGAQLNGLPVTTPPTAIVNVNGGVQTEPGALINNINIKVPRTGNAVNIEKNSILTNVVVIAPFGTCHPHTGTQLLGCSEFCCKFLDVEPVTGECNGGDLLVCACPQGSKFELPPFDPQPTESPADIRARNCVPCAPGDGPPAFPTCP
jgi:hypothetical protein